MTSALPLHHILREPLETTPGPRPAVVFLHGRGADEQDLFGLADMFDPRLAFLSVRAPFAYPWGGFTWYEIGPDGEPDEVMFRTSCEALVSFLEDLPGRCRVDVRRLVLFGFSMGAAMAHTILLSRPDLLRGVVAASGYVPERVVPDPLSGDLGDRDLLVVHGTHDPLLPIDFGRRSRDLYASSPVRLLYREFPGGHEIPDAVTEEAARFLAGILASTPEHGHA